MIIKTKHIAGHPGAVLDYIMGGKLGKDQIATVVDSDAIAISQTMRREIELIPSSDAERKVHKKKIWNFAQMFSSVFKAWAQGGSNKAEYLYQEYIISFSPEDTPKLSRAFLKQILNEIMEMMGIRGNVDTKRMKNGKVVTVKRGRRVAFLATAHWGTNVPHMHLLFCRVDEQGLVNDTKNERYRALAVCRALSKKYGLAMKANGREVTEKNGYVISKLSYQPDRKKANNGYQIKLEMKDAVLKCLDTATDFNSLSAALATYQIKQKILKHSTTSLPYGVIFDKEITEDGSIKHKIYSGTQLDRTRLTYGRICSSLKVNKEKDKALAAESPLEIERVEPVSQTPASPVKVDDTAVSTPAYSAKEDVVEIAMPIPLSDPTLEKPIVLASVSGTRDVEMAYSHKKKIARINTIKSADYKWSSDARKIQSLEAKLAGNTFSLSFKVDGKIRTFEKTLSEDKVSLLKTEKIDVAEYLDLVIAMHPETFNTYSDKYTTLLHDPFSSFITRQTPILERDYKFLELSQHETKERNDHKAKLGEKTKHHRTKLKH